MQQPLCCRRCHHRTVSSPTSCTGWRQTLCTSLGHTRLRVHKQALCVLTQGHSIIRVGMHLANVIIRKDRCKTLLQHGTISSHLTVSWGTRGSVLRYDCCRQLLCLEVHGQQRWADQRQVTTVCRASTAFLSSMPCSCGRQVNILSSLHSSCSKTAAVLVRADDPNHQHDLRCNFRMAQRRASRRLERTTERSRK